MKLVKFSPSAPAAGCRMPDARFPIADSRDQTPAASGAPTFWLAGTAPLSNDSCPLTVPAHRGRLGRRQPVADSALRISDFGLRAACFIRHSLFALLTAVALTASAQSESVYVVVEHIQRVQAAAGDFDGDGRSDFFLLDPVSGAVRIAYQTAPTEFTWQPAVGSGVSNITGVAVGHILLTNRPALAVTGPDANRVNVLSLTGTPPVPVTALPAGLGPSALVALDIGGGGSTPHHDLLVATRWNSPPNTSEIESLRSTGSAFTPLAATPLAFPATSANPAIIKTGAPPVAAFVLDAGGSSELRAWHAPAGVPVPLLVAAGFPADARFVCGRFGHGTPLAQFLGYVPGTANLLKRQVLEPVPGNFNLGLAATFDLGAPIGQVITLPGSGGQTRLLVTLADGSRQRVYTFDGTNAPVVIQQTDAAPGETFSGAVAVDGADFVQFGSDVATSEISFGRLYQWDGASFTAGPKFTVPTLRRANVAANVLLFRNEPFVSPVPQLLRTLNAADWSRDFAIGGGPPVVSVKREAFGTSATGLDHPTTVSLGTPPPLASHGLPNQYTAALSLFSFNPAVGDENAEISITPAPGKYPSAIALTLSSPVPTDTLFYRFNQIGSWQTYTAPLLCWTNITINFYGRSSAGFNSPIRSAAYAFDQSAGTQDSDSDGVPDYVEIAQGLDPNGGKDTDGDGYNDLDEMLAGSDPTNSASVPPAAYARLDERGFFDLILTPRPLNGLTVARTLSATGAIARAYSLPGALLGFQTTTNLFLPGISNSAARLTNVTFSATERLHVAATEEHFDLQTAAADKRIGRELLALYDLPPVGPFEVPYANGGGALATEAANWIVAAQAAAATNPRPRISRQLTSLDTLAALLTERKLADILLSRGTNSATNLTLFPARPADAGRAAIAQDALSAMEHQLSPALPGFLPHHVHSNLHWRVFFDAAPGVAALALVADEIYRLSSASNNAAPGSYPSPVNVLREFLESGSLHSNYAAVTMLSPAQLTTAATAVPAILAAVPPRPTTNLLARVRPDSFSSGHATIVELSTAPFTPFYLFNAEGGRFDFPDAFRLPVGSVVGVFGYTDVTNRFFPTNNLQVITAGVSSMPVISDPDDNGNLLIDTWEEFFNRIVGNPFADSDGDGYTDFQEMCDGSDPLDNLNLPPGPPLSFAAPVLEIIPDGLVIRIRFEWPASAIGKIVWGVRGADTLEGPFADLPTTLPLWLGGDQWEVTVPASGDPLGFYFLTLKLP